MALAAFWLPLLIAQSTASPPALNPLDLQDLDAATPRLRARVAEIRIEVDVPPDLPLLSDQEIAYGVVIDPRTVVCVAQLLDRAERIEIVGPTGAVSAVRVLDDRTARIALLEAERPLSSVGLEVSPPLPKAEREMDAAVFALISTTPDATTLSGVIADPGLKPEHEGHPTTSLRLTRGMPIFDARLRWLGLSRTLAWDPQKDLVIPPEMVDAARERHRAEIRKRSQPPAPQRPWWAK